MDLDKMFSRARDLHTEEYGDAKITGRHYNTKTVEFQKIVTKRSKSKKKLIQHNLLTPEQDRRLAIEIFVDAVFEGVPNAFENVSAGGEAITYSFDTAVDLFVRYPEFYTGLAEAFGDRKNFQDDEADAKN